MDANVFSGEASPAPLTRLYFDGRPHVVPGKSPLWAKLNHPDEYSRGRYNQLDRIDPRVSRHSTSTAFATLSSTACHHLTCYSQAAGMRFSLGLIVIFVCAIDRVNALTTWMYDPGVWSRYEKAWGPLATSRQASRCCSSRELVEPAYAEAPWSYCSHSQHIASFRHRPGGVPGVA